MASTSPAVFIKEVRTELGKVVWPTRQETIKLTIIVIAISALLGAYIGGLDAIFTKLTDIILKH